MHITPDQIVLWRWGFVHLNATILCTWIVMALLAVMSWLVTRNIDEGDGPRSRWQNALEVIVEVIRGQIREICPEGGDQYLPFVGTLFLFIAVSNLLDIVPAWHAPAGSLSTTAALAMSVGVAVPVFGVMSQGFVRYFRHYLSPTFVMLPLHLLSETSRNLALALRLFGNVMSGSLIAGILLSVIPLFFPVLIQALGLLTGMIQAYIFSILAMVYIAAAVQRGPGDGQGDSLHG
ncbi:MAG TPA: F0F1 ATP synthase subunit A [Bryobacteraceae bacterium]|jgi:F-type H+-transporting ATPase subunit a|nr:F0F1 ATP synthase subunit A [Bryobacteraceae bacterium]